MQDNEHRFHNSSHQFSLDGNVLPLTRLPQLLLLKSLVRKRRIGGYILLCVCFCVYIIMHACVHMPLSDNSVFHQTINCVCVVLSVSDVFSVSLALYTLCINPLLGQQRSVMCLALPPYE